MEKIYRLMGIVQRFRNLENHSMVVTAVLILAITVGVLNCILGYRLLRFWMMLVGIAAGAILGYLVVDSMGSPSQNLYIFGSAGCGIFVGVFTFFIYRAGIFMIGAVFGFVGSFYLIHPLAYSVLFVCLLIGTGFGFLTLKFSRALVIVATSVLGGSIAGFAGVKLAGLPDIPYGILVSLSVVLAGIYIQFAINQTEEDAAYTGEERIKKENKKRKRKK